MDLSERSYDAVLSPSSPSKRTNKPLVERKRRERINKSIDELKAIVLHAMNKDDKDYCKMEKADILEMVVKHLRAMKRQQLAAEACLENPSMWNNYRAGFNECASEVMHCMRNVFGVDPAIQIRLLSHLAESVERVNSNPATGQIKMAATQLRDVKPPRLMTSPVVTVPMATPERSLPGAVTPPATPVSRETHNLSPIGVKGHFTVTRVDQVVPGSLADLDLSCGNDQLSLTDSHDVSTKLSLYNNTTDFHGTQSSKLKMRSHVRGGDALTGSSKKTVSVSRQPFGRSVWRPW